MNPANPFSGYSNAELERAFNQILEVSVARHHQERRDFANRQPNVNEDVSAQPNYHVRFIPVEETAAQARFAPEHPQYLRLSVQIMPPRGQDTPFNYYHLIRADSDRPDVAVYRIAMELSTGPRIVFSMQIRQTDGPIEQAAELSREVRMVYEVVQRDVGIGPEQPEERAAGQADGAREEGAETQSDVDSDIELEEMPLDPAEEN